MAFHERLKGKWKNLRKDYFQNYSQIPEPVATRKLLKDRMRGQVRRVGYHKAFILFAVMIFKINSIKLKTLRKIIGNLEIFHIKLINKINTSN